MKAIKHSLEFAGPPKDGQPVPVPYSHMPTLHTHVVGYDIHGNRYEAHAGNGPDTYYWRIPGFVRGGQREVEGKARGLLNTFGQGYDLWKQEEALKAMEAKNQKPMVFKDNRSKGNKKPFNKKKAESAA